MAELPTAIVSSFSWLEVIHYCCLSAPIISDIYDQRCRYSEHLAAEQIPRSSRTDINSAIHGGVNHGTYLGL